MSAPEIAVDIAGYWLFDGSRCERAVPDPASPPDVVAFVNNPLLAPSSTIAVTEYSVAGTRVAVVFADFSGAGPGLDGAQRASAAPIISGALGGAITTFMFASPRDGRVLIEVHPRSGEKVRLGALAAAHRQCTVGWDLSPRIKVSAGRLRVEVLVERMGLELHFRLADESGGPGASRAG